MTLYVPRTFASDDFAAALRLIREHPFATLVTTGAGAEPHVSHVPLQHADGALWGHVAKANPHAAALAGATTTAIFLGPHAYVSPRWYAQPGRNVPTWNYAAVHVTGEAEVLGAEAARQVLVRATAQFEQGRWAPAPERLDALVAGIAAFRLPIEHWTAKAKFNQNRTAEDRVGVIAGLRGTGSPEDAAVARWMEAHAP